MEARPERHHLLLQITYNALASAEMEGDGGVTKALEYLTKAEDVYKQFCQREEGAAGSVEQAASSLQELQIGAAERAAPSAPNGVQEAPAALLKAMVKAEGVA